MLVDADEGVGANLNRILRAVRFHPDDVEALVRLSELLTKRNPTTRGQSELLFLYDRILRLEPDRHATRRAIR